MTINKGSMPAPDDVQNIMKWSKSDGNECFLNMSIFSRN